MCGRIGDQGSDLSTHGTRQHLRGTQATNGEEIPKKVERLKEVNQVGNFGRHGQEGV